MLPPLLTDRSHRNILLAQFRSPLAKNRSLENEVFDYNIIAARALKPHRLPLCSIQLPIDGSMLSPHAFLKPPAAMNDNFTAASDRKLITGLKRPNHVKNSHRAMASVNPNNFFLPQATVNTARGDLHQTRPKGVAEDFVGYPTFLDDPHNHDVELERRKINILVNNKHMRVQSNAPVPSQSTRNLPVTLYQETPFNSDNLPKHITSLEKYNIKLKKESFKASNS
jgi:hypothetical protein